MAPPVYFAHIPKCAGTSFIQDLADRGYRLTQPSGERCFLDGCGYAPDALKLTLLRSPRAHVYSEYLECRYDGFGKRATAGTDFPRSGSAVEGFEAWLDHFLADDGRRGLGEEGAFGCYNPHNMQARALACHKQPRSNPASDSLHRPSLAASLAPPLESVLLTLSRLVDLAGVVEMYAETWCLLEMRLTGRLPRRCEADCAASEDIEDAATSSGSDGHAHVTHGVPPHDWRQLPARVVRKIDNLTAVDAPLYAAAASGFLAAIADAEATSGKTILCAARRRAFLADVDYLTPLPDASETTRLLATRESADGPRCFDKGMRKGPPMPSLPSLPPTSLALISSTVTQVVSTGTTTATHISHTVAAKTRNAMTVVSANLEGHDLPRVKKAVDTYPLTVAAFVTSGVLIFLCCCCCCCCRYRSHIQAANKRRNAARRQRRDGKARLTPELSKQGKRSRAGATRVAAEDAEDGTEGQSVRPQRREMKLIRQPPRPSKGTKVSTVADEEEEGDVNGVMRME